MRVDLHRRPAHPRQDSKPLLEIEAARGSQAVDAVGSEGAAEAAERAAMMRGQQPEDRGDDLAEQLIPSAPRAAVLVYQAYPGDPVVLDAAQQDLEDHRVHVKVVVAIDAVQAQAGLEVALELGANLPLDLPAATPPPDPVHHPGPSRRGGEAPVGGREIGDRLGRRRRGRVAEGEMKPGGQPGALARECHRLVRELAGDEKAGPGEDALVVGAGDRGVDPGARAEVVTGDDQAAHQVAWTARRWRRRARKEKNS
jgi:hypothetical protein